MRFINIWKQKKCISNKTISLWMCVGLFSLLHALLNSLIPFICIMANDYSASADDDADDYLSVHQLICSVFMWFIRLHVVFIFLIVQ